MIVNEIVDEQERLSAIVQLLKKLPPANYSTLAVVVELLFEVSKRSKVNKSNRRLLARTFGPLLLRRGGDHNKLVKR